MASANMALVSLQLGDCNPQSPAGAGGRAVKALRTEQVLEELAVQSARITRLEKRINELDVQLAASKGREKNLARRVAELESSTPTCTGTVSTSLSQQESVGSSSVQVELTKEVPNEQESVGSSSVQVELTKEVPNQQEESDAQTTARSVEVGLANNCPFPAEANKDEPADTGESPDTLWDDKEVVMGAVTRMGTALEFASEDAKADREVVLRAVQNAGEALQWASNALKANREVVLAAVNQNGAALKFAAGNLRDDKDLYLLSMQTCEDGLLDKTAKKLGA